MELKDIKLEPMGLSFDPEFHIKVTLAYQDVSRVFLKLNGYLFMDRFRVSTLHDYNWNISSETDIRGRTQTQGSKWQPTFVFVAPFSRQVLDKFEDKRNRDPKGDLILDLILEFGTLESNFDEIQTSISNKGVLLPSITNSSILKYKTYKFQEQLRIPSSDWIHDFIPVFEKGKYQVFELPIPKIVTGNSDLGNKLNASIGAIKKMGEAKVEGEWTNVIKESRPIWELVKNKTEINELLSKDGLDTTAVTAYNDLIKAFFEFSSKFIHFETKDQKLMLNKACKEDAELIYSMSISIVNLITKKLNK